MKTSRGFSLYEALITLALAAGVLGIAGDLMASYTSKIRHSASQENTNTAWLVLQRLAQEVNGSLTLDAPVPGDVGTVYNEIRYLTLDPGFTTWVPRPLASPNPASWDPFPPAQMLEVRVSATAQEELIREVGPAGGSPTQRYLLVGERVADFRATVLADGRIELAVELREPRGLQVYRHHALRMLP